jgi:Rrf2 family protein
MYGKQTECAIAVMSRLAEVYDKGRTRLSANDLADARGLQRPRVAKCLASLSQAGLVSGAPGPGGGFALADHPRRIFLRNVFDLFERYRDHEICPFGGGKCGVGISCPLHDRLASVHKATNEFLDRTSFEVFRAAYQENGWRP